MLFGGINGSALGASSPLPEGSSSSVTDGEPVYIHPTDAQYLNRIFIERDHEIGYCVDISGDKLSFWLADTVKSSEASMTMKTSNCPDDMRDATTHTHPSGNVGLSVQDKQTLITSDEPVMCVHAGEIPVEPGAELDDLVCYKEGDYEDPMRIPVHVTDSDTEAGARLRGYR